MPSLGAASHLSRLPVRARKSVKATGSGETRLHVSHESDESFEVDLLVVVHREMTAFRAIEVLPFLHPAHMEMMSRLVQKGQYLYCPEGSHLSMYDDQKVYFDGLVQFVRDVEAHRF